MLLPDLGTHLARDLLEGLCQGWVILELGLALRRLALERLILSAFHFEVSVISCHICGANEGLLGILKVSP